MTVSLQDEEDGWKWGNKNNTSTLAALADDPSALMDMDYMGPYNNNSELAAMKREMNAKYNANSSNDGSPVRGEKRSSIVESFRRGSAGAGGAAGPGSRMRTLKPLGARRQAAAAVEEKQDDELPSGNCVVM